MLGAFAMPKIRLGYWDTCVFIDLFQQTAGRFDACRHLQTEAIKGTLQIVTSAVTLAELIKFDSPSTTQSQQSKVILDFLQNDYFVIRQLDRATAELAHSIRQSHKLTTIDAIHVATAIISGASVLYTYDGVTQKRKGLIKCNLMIGNPPMRIESPPEPPAPSPPPITLFSEEDKEKKDDTANQSPAT
jgi:predicted nucleic acid-binding protein